MKFGVIILFLSVITLDRVHAQKKDWWETAAFYQIYPRSFKDSNGDGIGDLNGITEKLSYLKEIGITATWLSPIFKSPMADFGYDISDFFDIQPEYGTMVDFEKLVARGKEIGIKIILDFVPNHSSDENEWFKKSVNRDVGYEDFYVWHEGYPDPNNSSNRLPPSNWLSAFRKSAWEWNSKRKQFYLHQFATQQPDLNYRSPKVVEAMKSVLRFWLNKGVAGFRIDAVPWLFEALPDANGILPNEPKSGLTDDPDDAAYLKHIYTQDLDETLDMVYQWRKVLDDFKSEHGGDTRVMMTEAHSTIDIVMKYYGNGHGRDGSHIPFNFQMLPHINPSPQNAYELVRIVKLWLNNLPLGRTANWVVGNHDSRRVASRLGVENVDAINTLVQSLPGASVTYNGEEIGMTDFELTWEETVDPAACNSNKNIYQKFSRDPARTPFQWDSTLNAGFSTAAKTWLPISPTYTTVNVKQQQSDPNSHLSKYKKLLALRQTQTYKYGSVYINALNSNVVSLVRYAGHSEPYYVTLINYGKTKENVKLSAIKKLQYVKNRKIRSIEYPENHSLRNKLLPKIVTLEPHGTLILRGD